MTSEHPPAARGRPRKLTADAVVDAAVALIVEDGFTSLSTRSLAQRLGVRSSTLYSYFGSVEEIAEAAVSRMLDGIRVPDLGTAADPVDALVRFFVDLRDLLIAHPDAIPARLDSRPWAQMVGMVNTLLRQFLEHGLTVDRAAACYEALIGVTMASAATARRAQQASAAEIELLLTELDPTDTDTLLRLRTWASEPDDVRFRSTVRELVRWMLPALGGSGR
ncbi:MAG: TetR/AcrR family transcriptional regulator [Microbacterium sp.]|uniref:TetR/AcrR family transcriptional regulator n=1 Tax=Microbacterium sp. TaxID=51671 RepID=UPI0028236B53|nr:TetR/AcrR family transcriptional regulator [Microbacterium sp.]MDR2322829.1 TetR/AcrR family transcriptional regulator [Microbacterium sp.]